MALRRWGMAAAAAALFIAAGAPSVIAQNQPRRQAPAWSANLEAIRRAATMIPGPRPLRINVLKFAESHRSKKFSVKGAPDQPSVQARTVYQVVYADGTIMVDSGMDRQVHQFFGHGAIEPYDTAAAKQVEKALLGAREIVMTHEHGDHIAGVIHTPLFSQLAPKTVLTAEQVHTLETHPQMPEIRLTPEMARHFIVVDYQKYLPFAPGFVLIKAPGHTPGSQMIYVALASGREYLLVGDAAWHMDNVRLVRGKDAPWVKEDTAAVMAQLRWLHRLYRTQKNLFIVVSHDDQQRREYVAKGILGNGLE